MGALGRQFPGSRSRGRQSPRPRAAAAAGKPRGGKGHGTHLPPGIREDNCRERRRRNVIKQRTLANPRHEDMAQNVNQFSTSFVVETQRLQVFLENSEVFGFKYLLSFPFALAAERTLSHFKEYLKKAKSRLSSLF